MATEDIGEGKDLELKDEDAENVVGGLKKKKAKKKVVAKKTPAKTAAAVTTVAPTTLPQMTQAEMEAYDKDMVEHGLDPVYGTIPSE